MTCEIFSHPAEQPRLRVPVRHLPRQRRVQHVVHKVRVRRAPPDGMWRRPRLRREEPHVRLARSALALLQPRGRRRFQVPEQAAKRQGRQVLALPQVKFRGHWSCEGLGISTRFMLAAMSKFWREVSKRFKIKGKVNQSFCHFEKHCYQFIICYYGSVKELR